jgi:hypothetical protein
MANPTETHLKALPGILQYLKTTANYVLTYSEPRKQLRGYSDAAYADDIPSRRSTQGYTYDIGSGTLSWASKLQATISLSTCEVEYKALAFATKEAVWLARLLNEITDNLEPNRSPTATIIYGDNQGSIALAKNPVFHARSKHVDVQHHFVREKVASGEVEVQFVPTKDQIADGLTKALPKDSFYAFRRALGIESENGITTKH